MSSKGKLKRILSDSESSDSKSGSEDETRELPLQRSTKKKRICLDSGSESESGYHDKNILKNREKFHVTSDEDEPLKNKTEKLKVSTPANSAKDKPLASNSRNSSVHSDGSKKFSTSSSLSDEVRLEDTSDDDEDEPISNMTKKKGSKLIENSKAMQHYSSDSSEDEPIAKKYRKASKNPNDQTAKSLLSEPKEEFGATSDKDEIISHNTSPKKLEEHDTSSCNSEDGPVKSRNSPKYLKTSKKTELISEKDNTESEVSSDEKLSNKAESKTNGNSKADSSSDSEEEFLPVKNKNSKQTSNSKKNKNPSITKRDSTSSDEEPLSKIAKGSKNVKKLPKKHHSSSSSDDEPLATKISVNKKLKSQKNSDLSSDDEEKPLSSVSKMSKEKINQKKNKSSSNDKIDHLKKYLRVAGIHVNSYDKLFEDCKSIKSKAEKLLGLLHAKGLKGRPTIEKCKKLKKKIETKKEIAELDVSNIIKSEGRPKRGAGGKTFEKVQNTDNSPAKKFMRLRDIIDSEESD